MTTSSLRHEITFTTPAPDARNLVQLFLNEPEFATAGVEIMLSRAQSPLPDDDTERTVNIIFSGTTEGFDAVGEKLAAAILNHGTLPE